MFYSQINAHYRIVADMEFKGLNDYLLTEEISKFIRQHLRTLLGTLSIRYCDANTKHSEIQKTKGKEFEFTKTFRTEEYEYELGGVGSKECAEIFEQLKRKNPIPQLIKLKTNFHEKGYFDVSIDLTKEALKLLEEKPEELKKEISKVAKFNV